MANTSDLNVIFMNDQPKAVLIAYLIKLLIRCLYVDIFFFITSFDFLN